MADHQNDYKPGSMDIRGHEKTFAGFIRISTWAIGIALAALIFMTLTNV